MDTTFSDSFLKQSATFVEYLAITRKQYQIGDRRIVAIKFE